MLPTAEKSFRVKLQFINRDKCNVFLNQPLYIICVNKEYEIRNDSRILLTRYGCKADKYSIIAV